MTTGICVRWAIRRRTGRRFATGANRDGGTGTRERESGSARGTAGAENEDATFGEVKFLFEGAEHTDVVGVRTSQRTVGADDDGVDRADVGGEIVAVFEMLQDFLLVRNRDAETANAEVGDGFEKVGQVVNQEGQVDCVHLFGGERGIVEERGERVADWISDDAEDASAAIQFVSAIEML